MKRRDFLALTGAAAAFPRVALAQQAAKVPRIAFLGIVPQEWAIAAIRQGLADHGYVDGTTMRFELFSAPTTPELATFAAKAVASNPDIIIANGSAGPLALKSITTAIPVVFLGNDPLGQGLVTSLARPGGNMTGVSLTAPDLVGRQLAIIKEIIPTMKRIAVLSQPVAAITAIAEAVRNAAPALGLEAVIIEFVEGQDFAGQFDRVVATGAQAFYQPSSAYFLNNGPLIAELQIKNKLPSITTPGDLTQPFPGLVAYGPNIAAMWRRTGAFVDAILKGAKPQELPVEQPTVFELAINQTTAKALGITIPSSVLAQATIVIE